MSDDGKSFKIGGNDSFNMLQMLSARKLQQQGNEVEKLRDVASKASGIDATKKQEVEKAATQFESMLVHELFKSMWSSVPQEGMLSGSREEEIYRDMLNDALATEVANKQSIGIKDVIIQDISKLQKRASLK